MKRTKRKKKHRTYPCLIRIFLISFDFTLNQLYRWKPIAVYRYYKIYARNSFSVFLERLPPFDFALQRLVRPPLALCNLILSLALYI